jgi:lysyl-tRNA synthetase class 2
LNSVSWRPTASLETLRLRAELLAEIRRFCADRGLLEVETPALSAAGAPDPALEHMTVQAAGLGAEPCYLHTSPEVAMKRLLAADAGDIYQICRVFRDGELGRWHEPEFTLLEWYRVGWDEEQLMGEVESLLVTLLKPHRRLAPAVRMSYRDAFRDFLSVDPFADGPELRDALSREAIDIPADTAGDGLLDLALSQAIVPRLDPHAISFIYDFPASQAALARIKPQEPPVAARFEAFSGGIELANGFGELTDVAEHRKRFDAALALRHRGGRHGPPPDERFLEALLHGLPPCAGVAVGVDRVVALAAGLTGVAATMSFAHGADSEPN